MGKLFHCSGHLLWTPVAGITRCVEDPKTCGDNHICNISETYKFKS